MSIDNHSKPMMTRRAATAAVAAPLLVPRHVLGGAGYQAPSDTLAIACVGAAGMGRNYLEGCKAERIVALCDLDFKRSEKVFATYPTARTYRDFRQMFDKEEKNFDALIIATPDHWHHHLLLAALRMKKHIYCAKPVTHSVAEARRVKQAVLASNVVTKASIQDSRTEYARATTELLLSGAIGPVREIHLWTGSICPGSLVRPTDTQPAPEEMDWDMWCGPSAFRPFHKTYHPENWRPWWDFGTGTVGDFGCHTMHMFFEELQLAAPSAFHGVGSCRQSGFFQRLETPECQSDANMVTWEYPSRGKLPPLEMFFYDGGMMPHRPRELDHSLQMPSSGLMFVGENGKLIAGFYGGNPWGRRGPGNAPAAKTIGLPGGLLLPQQQFVDFPQPPPTLVRCQREDHYTEWTRCCKQGEKTVTPIEFACEMTEVALLGTLALRLDSAGAAAAAVATGPARRRQPPKILEWESKAMKVVNDDHANGLLDPPYRKKWDKI